IDVRRTAGIAVDVGRTVVLERDHEHALDRRGRRRGFDGGRLGLGAWRGAIGVIEGTAGDCETADDESESVHESLRAVVYQTSCDSVVARRCLRRMDETTEGRKMNAG